MKFSSLLNFAATALTVFKTSEAAYSATGKNNAVYWGQGSGQESLATYCKAGNIDIVMLSFLRDWDASSASFNFGNACGTDGTCPQIAEDIVTCQNLGIKVLLSLGGDKTLGTYGVSSDAEGANAAKVIYNMFHPKGSASVKPFGTAEIDGLDFDIENDNQNGLASLVVEIRKLWTTKTLLISAAPQCPYPDKNVYKMLEDKNAKVDIAWVQFYNNPACSFNNDAGFKSSWATWYDFVTTKSGNSNMKIYIGVASSTSDSDYFVDASTTATRSASMLTQKSFGGFCLWDASSGTAKVTNGVTYIQSLKNILESKSVTKRFLNGINRAFTVISP
ncbi:hypothetical protein DASC09_024020 [Saccharomycopsis crataegensis]|uniref:chitinase n=1 Tax=Saccharomycopsis crataegensis TaxID=43959 RepID=A0AAV5QKJ2_9ASCO|nr:hypothetical protein DASC09_024020 [Saccharomycopsis crataegensis]